MRLKYFPSLWSWDTFNDHRKFYVVRYDSNFTLRELFLVICHHLRVRLSDTNKRFRPYISTIFLQNLEKITITEYFDCYGHNGGLISPKKSILWGLPKHDVHLVNWTDWHWDRKYFSRLKMPPKFVRNPGGSDYSQARRDEKVYLFFQKYLEWQLGFLWFIYGSHNHIHEIRLDENILSYLCK